MMKNGNDKKSTLVISERADYAIGGAIGLAAFLYAAYVFGKALARAEETYDMLLFGAGLVMTSAICIAMMIWAGYKIEWEFFSNGRLSITRSVWGIRQKPDLKEVRLPLDVKISVLKVYLSHEHRLNLMVDHPRGIVSVGRFGLESEAIENMARLREFYADQADD